MKRALCLIRDALVYRRTAFVSGLRVAGYDVVNSITKPTKDDVLVTWNRYGNGNEFAEFFERSGARVIVVENGYLGKSWLGDRWFAMSLSQHAGAGEWLPGDATRWDKMKIMLAPWKEHGSETIILAQRGIGSEEVKSPDNWAEKTKRKLGTGRIRAHPGKGPPEVSLADDLRSASSVVTWTSSAALQALIIGVPVWYDYEKWIGGSAGKHLSSFGKEEPLRDDEKRLDMFRSLIWAMWRASEVEDGSAFRHLLRE